MGISTLNLPESCNNISASTSLPSSFASSGSAKSHSTFMLGFKSAPARTVLNCSSSDMGHTFDADFSLYNNMRQPSKLAPGADLNCFKYNIEPKWEHPICANGGKWTINCHRGKSDTWWLYTLLAMIGEQFDLGDEICGAVNVRRKQEKISLWTESASNEAAQDDARKLDRLAKDHYSILPEFFLLESVLLLLFIYRMYKNILQASQKPS